MSSFRPAAASFRSTRLPVFALLVLVLLSLSASSVAAGPLAYAACQSAAAAGCLTTGPGFALCYATAQTLCSAMLAMPSP